MATPMTDSHRRYRIYNAFKKPNSLDCSNDLSSTAGAFRCPTVILVTENDKFEEVDKYNYLHSVGKSWEEMEEHPVMFSYFGNCSHENSTSRISARKAPEQLPQYEDPCSQFAEELLIDDERFVPPTPIKTGKIKLRLKYMGKVKPTIEEIL
jgi:hypothetical protein